MRTRVRSVFGFPNPVNEVAARVVAGGVVVHVRRWPSLCANSGCSSPSPTASGRGCSSGPTLSPLGQLATRVIAPRLPVPPRPVAGPPKRFAQAMGVVFSSTAVVLWFGFGAHTAAWVVIGLLTVAAVLESAFGLCLGCRVFSVLMRVGLVPDSVCEACADISRAPPRAPATSPPGPEASRHARRPGGARAHR